MSEQIDEVKELFPDIPIIEQSWGFQMMDRPCIPSAVVAKLDGKVRHIGAYCFEWVEAPDA